MDIDSKRLSEIFLLIITEVRPSGRINRTLLGNIEVERERERGEGASMATTLVIFLWLLRCSGREQDRLHDIWLSFKLSSGLHRALPTLWLTAPLSTPAQCCTSGPTDTQGLQSRVENNQDSQTLVIRKSWEVSMTGVCGPLYNSGPVLELW